MAKGKIEIRTEYCKGCQLCISACKFQCLSLSSETQTNKYGFRYAVVANNDKCMGCAMCARMCPDQGIRVFRD